MDFTEGEKSVIRQAIDKRALTCDAYPKWLNIIAEIKLLIDSPISRLKSTKRSFLIGCIKEHVIEPNEDIAWMCDYAIFLAENSAATQFAIVDHGINILRKLKDSDYVNVRTISSVQDTIERIKKVREVRYSHVHGKIYKAALMFDLTKGIEIDCSRAPYEKFDVKNFVPNQFMSSSKPDLVLAYLKERGRSQRLEENQLRLIALLESIKN